MNDLYKLHLTHYRVDKDGSVYGLKTGTRLKGSIHKTTGYASVSLSYKGKSRTFLLHRLVAAVHIPNPEDKPCINHKDCNKLNNSVENLEWVTHSENTRHGMASGRIVFDRSRVLWKNRAFDMEDLEKILKLKEQGHYATAISRMTGLSRNCISAVLTGHTYKREVAAIKALYGDKQ